MDCIFSYMSQIQVGDPLTAQIRGHHDIQMQRKWAIAAAIAHLRRASAALDPAPMRGRSRASAVRMDADRHANLAGSLAWPSEAPLTRG